MLVVPGCAAVLSPRAQPSTARAAAPAAAPTRRRRRVSGGAARRDVPDPVIDHLHRVGPLGMAESQPQGARGPQETPKSPSACCLEVNDTIPAGARVRTGWKANPKPPFSIVPVQGAIR